MRFKKRWLGMVTAILLMALVAGCGGPKADLTIFMSHEFPIPEENVAALQQELNDKLNGEYTVQIFASPLYNAQKIMLEYAAAGNGLIVLPREDVMKYSENGGNLALDEYFNPADYEEGVFEGRVDIKLDDNKIEEKTGKFLFALPTEKLTLMKKHSLVEKQWFIAVPATTPNMDLSVKVLNLLMK